MTLNRLAWALALGVAAAGCTTTKPVTRPDEGTRQVEKAPVATEKTAASTPGEVQIAPRALRLFDDAVKSFNDQKQLKVFDWALLEKQFRAVVDADPRFAEAWYDLGVLAEKQGRPDEARTSYRTALEKKPSLSAAAENLAVMLQNEGKAGDALAIYQDILRRQPDDGGARARMAALYLETEDTERAQRFAREALMRDPQNLTAHKVLMRFYVARKDVNMARLLAGRALKQEPNDPEMPFVLATILLKEGDEAGATAQLARAVEVRDDYLPARLQLGQLAARHRDWVNCAEQYKKIAQYAPRSVAARVNLGISFKGLGQYDKAMAEYDAASKLDPGAPEPYYVMGVLFQRHKDAPDKAIEYYKKFIAASKDQVPGDHPVFAHIKEAEQYMQQLKDAKEAEEKAKLAAKAAEEKAKADAAEKARLEAEKKKADEDKAKAEADAKAKQEADEKAKKDAEERARRQKDAKDAVDSALTGGGQQPADGKPADEGADGKKPDEAKKPDDGKVAADPKDKPAPDALAPKSDEPKKDEPKKEAPKVAKEQPKPKPKPPRPPEKPKDKKPPSDEPLDNLNL